MSQPVVPRADVIGSLLRPDALRRAQAAHAEGRLSKAELRAAEDEAVREAVAVQRRVGLRVLTDGEMRRRVFYDQLTRALDGYQPLPPGTVPEQSLRWQGGAGGPEGQVMQAACVEPLRRTAFLAVEEFRFLKEVAGDALPKCTLPAPSLLARYWVRGYSEGAYPTREAYLADVVRHVRDEVQALVDLGARYIQFDGPNYGLILDERYRRLLPDPWQDTLGMWIEVDNAAMSGFSDVTFGLHMCRGNSAGRYAAEGGYEAIADLAFPALHADRLLLEYDTPRAGTFEPLRAIPQDRTVVLGLVSTKTPSLEDPQSLRRRVDEASRTFPRAQLALSPQCGFASVAEGNPLTWEQQEEKLRLVVSTAEAIWGEP